MAIYNPPFAFPKRQTLPKSQYHPCFATVTHLNQHLLTALALRAPTFIAPDEKHEGAFRLFNGFIEGCPTLAIDIYGRTAVLFNHSNPPPAGEPHLTTAVTFLRQHLPWLNTIIRKDRHATQPQHRNGRYLHGDATTAARAIREHGIRYALDLTLNQDASLYLDTRTLRHWLIHNSHGKTILNTFAYTSTLGVAAQAGGASSVIHTDLSKQFLNLAKTSYTLNGFPIHKKNFRPADFWHYISQLKRQNARFDTIILDPPFFSKTNLGTLDTTQDIPRLINKLRPLVRHGGHLIAINNALFANGQTYLTQLNSLTADGYVQIHQLLPIDLDFIGDETTRHTPFPANPAPFNHPTKIAILTIRHKPPQPLQ